MGDVLKLQSHIVVLFFKPKLTRLISCPIGAEPQAVDKNHRPVSYHLYALPTQVVSPAQLPSPNGVNSMDETIADHYEFSDEVLPNGLGTESHYEMEPYAEATVTATALPGQYEVPLSALSNYRSEEVFHQSVPAVIDDMKALPA